MKLPPNTTYRQLHHWVAKGYIFPPDDPATAPGAGHPRKWSPKDLRKLRALSQLRQIGFEVGLAADVAETAATISLRDAHGSIYSIDEQRWVTVNLPMGVTLTIDRDIFFEKDIEDVDNP